MGKFGNQGQATNSNGRRWMPLGFVSAALAQNAVQDVTSQPPVAFQGQRLVVPSAIAASFDINSIKVNTIPQLVSDTPIPAACFVENAQLTDLGDMDDCPAQGKITINVTQNAATATAFKATLFGWAAR